MSPAYFVFDNSAGPHLLSEDMVEYYVMDLV